MAKAGIVEALYVGECIGLIVIWTGDRVCARQDLVRGNELLSKPALRRAGP
jgi:hypothetical protein